MRKQAALDEMRVVQRFFQRRHDGDAAVGGGEFWLPLCGGFAHDDGCNRTLGRLGIGDIAFAARLRREPELRTAIEGWLADVEDELAWVEWEQRKHERLLRAA